jgi:lipoprotein
MRKKITVLALALLLLGLCGLYGCGGKVYEVGKWERQRPRYTATFEELQDKDLDYFRNLRNQYVKFTFEIDGFVKASNGIYYCNKLDSREVTALPDYLFSIVAISYQNYWELPFEEGDSVTVDGYCRVNILKPFYSDYGDFYKGSITVYVDPCYAVKA